MNTKVIKFDYQKLRNPEHLQLIRLIIEVLLKHNPEKLNILILFNELRRLFREEETAISVEQGSSYTVLRDAADSKRDRIYSAFFHLVKSFTFDESDQQAFDAGQRVMRIVNQVGNPSKLADHAQTTTIFQLNNELRPYIEDVKLIGADRLLDRLIVANTDFERIDTLCREDKNNRPSGNVRAVRTQINPVYLAIINAINADVDRFMDGRLNAVVVDLNAIIKEYDMLLTQRKARNSNNNPEDMEN